STNEKSDRNADHACGCQDCFVVTVVCNCLGGVDRFFCDFANNGNWCTEYRASNQRGTANWCHCYSMHGGFASVHCGGGGMCFFDFVFFRRCRCRCGGRRCSRSCGCSCGRCRGGIGCIGCRRGAGQQHRTERKHKISVHHVLPCH